MGTNTGSTRALGHRPHGQARLTRNSVENGDASHSTLSSELRNESNTTTRTSSTPPPRPSRRHVQRHSEIPPPKYDDLFPPARAPASRRPARVHPSTPEGMDPLVAAMWHNENLSLFLSLPDHLLIKIIEILSDSGVERIRRVSRRFPPLCVRQVLSPLRRGRPRLSETGPLNWPRFGTSSYLRPNFLGLVDRDEYCDGCQAARMSPRWEQKLRQLTEYTHCSACGADHPACLFSATQRLKPARLRYCIAHEGCLRICDHDDGTVRLSRLLNPERKPWKQRKEDFTTIQCRHPSHDKWCQKVPGGSFPKSTLDCGSSRGVCNGVRWPSIRGAEKTPNIFDIYWTAHVPFNGEMDALRSQVAEICDNAGKYIVPRASSATETPELRCFDPNDCHCITYSGTENVRWEWECGPWLPGTTRCISDPFGGLNPLQPTRPPVPVLSNVVHQVVQILKSRIAPECTAEPKTHRARDEAPPLKYGPGRCTVDVRPCHTGKDCLAVDYMRTLRVSEGGKICPQWYNTLDPGSYNITDDQDGLGVFWCPQPRCRNYFKGLPNYAGILRHHDFRRECRHYDCQ